MRPTVATRALFYTATDLAAFVLAAVGTFGLHYGLPASAGLLNRLILFTLLLAVCKEGMVWLLKVQFLRWQSFDLRDVPRVGLAILTGSALAYGSYVLLAGATLPATVVVIDLGFSILLVLLVRFGRRICLELYQRRAAGSAVRVGIVGTGATAYRFARTLFENPRLSKRPVAMFDTVPMLVGTRILGVPVLGIEELGEQTRQAGIEELYVAVGRETECDIRDVQDRFRAGGGQRFYSLDGLERVFSAGELLKRNTLTIQELAGRRVVGENEDDVRGLISGRRVLVTGAAGSVGSELCRQLARFSPDRLVLFERGETELVELCGQFGKEQPGVEVVPVLGDVQDTDSLNAAMEEHRPNLVLHTAAYKHVPVLEHFPEMAFRNNVLGTLNVCRAAQKVGAERVVFISTDKAVSPTCVLGRTKRAAERVVQGLSGGSGTKFITVRFGNVLESRGSVTTIFRQQILEGGPVTVTDPGMLRYFMALSEAANLVLEACAVGRDGELLVLNMGAPVPVVDVARRMIRLAGLEPDKDIEIVFTGVRPGEKLTETLFEEDELPEPVLGGRLYRVGPDSRESCRELLIRIEAALSESDLREAGRIAVEQSEGAFRA